MKASPLPVCRAPPGQVDLDEKPCAECHLNEVVHDDGVLEVVGLPVLHEPGSQELDCVEVESAKSERGQGAVHQGPIVNPPVPQVPDLLQDPLPAAGAARVRHCCAGSLTRTETGICEARVIRSFYLQGKPTYLTEANQISNMPWPLP